MAAAGATFSVEAPGMEPLEALLAGQHMALAEAYLHERVDVVGSFEDIIQVTNHLAYESPGRLREWLWWLRFLLDRRGLDRSPASQVPVRDQHAFVSERIWSQQLPCQVECVDFLDFRPGGRFDGAVCMGSLEHLQPRAGDVVIEA